MVQLIPPRIIFSLLSSNSIHYHIEENVEVCVISGRPFYAMLSMGAIATADIRHGSCSWANYFSVSGVGVLDDATYEVSMMNYFIICLSVIDSPVLGVLRHVTH